MNTDQSFSPPVTQTQLKEVIDKSSQRKEGITATVQLDFDNTRVQPFATRNTLPCRHIAYD